MAKPGPKPRVRIVIDGHCTVPGCGLLIETHPRCPQCRILIGPGHLEPYSYDGLCGQCSDRVARPVAINKRRNGSHELVNQY